MLPTSIKGSCRSFIVGLFSLLMVACGGDGELSDSGTTDNDDTTNATYTLGASLQDQDGNGASNLALGEVLTLQMVLKQDGEAYAGQTVTITNSSSDLAALSTTSVVTDNDGVASVALTGGASAGNGTLTVTSELSGLSELSVGYVSLGDVSGVSGRAYLVPASTSVSDFPNITASLLSTVSLAEPGLVVVQLLDTAGQPIANELVLFTLADGSEGLLTFGNDTGTVITDVNGYASISVSTTDVAGAGELSVSYDGEPITTLVFNASGDGNEEQAVSVGSIVLLVDRIQIPSSAADDVELTALVKDSNNNYIEGASVTFSSSSGGIESLNNTTGSDGIATARLSTESDQALRDIIVTASVGDKSVTRTLEVVGTTIKIGGDDSIVTGNRAVYSVAVLDSDGNSIDSQRIYLSNDFEGRLFDVNGDVLPTEELDSGTYYFVDTDDSAEDTSVAQFSYIANTSGPDQVVATALGATTSKGIIVSPDMFVIDSLEVNGELVGNSEVPMKQGGIVTLTWQKDDAPYEGDVLFSITRGEIYGANADPDVDDPLTASISSTGGTARVQVVSSNAGPAKLTAKGDGLTASFDLEFVAEVAHQITLQASPFSIGPDGQSSTINAVVRDINGNLVKNRPVNFKLFDTSGGSISVASDITSSKGLASTVYTSNTVSSLEGVKVVACTDTEGETSDCIIVENTNGDNNSANDTYDCSVSVAGKECTLDEVGLTVADREAYITAGFGNGLGEPTDQEYQYDIPVYVTDINSAPISGVDLSISAVPTGYQKGFWVKFEEDNEFVRWDPLFTASCINEDADRDGVLDVADAQGNVNEDTNLDGVLTPGNVVRIIGDTVTDENGYALVSIVYPQSYGAWAQIEFVVSAEVSGTEHVKRLDFILPVLQDDLVNEDFQPVGNVFGSSTSCSDTD